MAAKKEVATSDPKILHSMHIDVKTPEHVWKARRSHAENLIKNVVHAVGGRQGSISSFRRLPPMQQKEDHPRKVVDQEEAVYKEEEVSRDVSGEDLIEQLH